MVLVVVLVVMLVFALVLVTAVAVVYILYHVTVRYFSLSLSCTFVPSRPFPYAHGRDLSNGLPRDSWQIAGSGSTNRIAVYEPRARARVLRLPVKSTRGQLPQRLYRRWHARRGAAKVRTGREGG